MSGFRVTDGSAILLFSYFAALQTIVPLLPPQANVTASSGDKAVLHCPIQPGALLLQYSVMWKKGNNLIAKVTNPQGQLESTNARYRIDRGRYSLIINPPTINDTSTDYQCELSVTNPLTNVLQVLQPSPPVTLSLKVICKLIK